MTSTARSHHRPRLTKRGYDVLRHLQQETSTVSLLTGKSRVDSLDTVVLALEQAWREHQDYQRPQLRPGDSQPPTPMPVVTDRGEARGAQRDAVPLCLCCHLAAGRHHGYCASCWFLDADDKRLGQCET